jgi:Flp pilus assembly protein TadG
VPKRFGRRRRSGAAAVHTALLVAATFVTAVLIALALTDWLDRVS